MREKGMRTKAEIKQEIEQIREWRDTSRISIPSLRDRYEQACGILILGLKYALGYKIGKRYWCVGCARYHKNVKCPKCGSDYLVTHNK